MKVFKRWIFMTVLIYGLVLVMYTIRIRKLMHNISSLGATFLTR